MTVIGSATYMASSDEVRKLMFLVLALMNYAVIFAWIYAFYVRMQHSGKVCSGDFLEDSDSKEGFLVQQGIFIKYAIACFLTLFILAITYVACLIKS